MEKRPIFSSGASGTDPVPRILSACALLVAIVALVFAMNGVAPAESTSPKSTHDQEKAKGPKSTKAAKPADTKAIKAVARRAQKAQKAAAQATKKVAALSKKLPALESSCPVSGAIDLGSWCLEGSTFKVPSSEAGQNDYLYATQKCVQEGGWLPSAAQLIGAAPVVALKSVVGDDPGTSADSEFPDPSLGIKDEREMTGDLFTTSAGSRAAGSEGVSDGAKGVGNSGEPNPVPIAAEPLPETLDYVTVYDNHNIGGFAGGEPVGKPESFRCAYAEGYQGKPKDVSSRS
jgi:hypothetical protein